MRSARSILIVLGLVLSGALLAAAPFASKPGRFSAAFPVKPTEEIDADGPVTMHNFSAEDPGGKGLFLVA